MWSYPLSVLFVLRMDSVTKWLRRVHTQHLTRLQYVDIGLGYQSFRLQFVDENSCFDFVVRDELRCKTFIAQFTGKGML